jgi:hypothetical protein
MAINLGAYNGFNLQGGATTAVPGVAQAGSGSVQGMMGPQTPTINNSATVPTTPKAKYVQAQTQNLQPANVPPANGAGLSFMNGTMNAQGQYVANQTQNPASQSTPAAPTGMNGYSGGIGSTQGVYDPYQSPAFQQYVQQAVTAATPAYTNPQIQQGIVGANTALQNIQTNVANSMGGLANKDLSSSGMTAQQDLINQNAAYASVPYQTQANLLAQQQTQAETAANIPLTAATTEAGYLSGLAQPTAIGTGQNLVLPNPATGQATTLASQPSYGLGTGIAGQPITYNQNTGAINSGGTGLGATPPTLSGTTGATGEAGALQSIGQAYGLTDPASQLALKTAVDNTLASNGDVNAAGVPANLQPAVKAVLNQMSGGTYSPGNAAINQTNLAAQQAVANTLIAPMQTAVSHLADLQSLANAVGYTNSPIASNIRNQFSGSILTDPKITNLQSAIGVVRSEVAKVLGGGTPTVASQAEAAEALPDNLSPQNIAGVIANVTSLMNAKIQQYTNPANAASLLTGLQMPSTGGTGLQMPPAGSLKL